MFTGSASNADKPAIECISGRYWKNEKFTLP